MTLTELKKTLLVSSVAVVATMGLSACGEDDKAKAPSAQEATEDATTSSAMDDAEKKAAEMADEAKAKADAMMDEAKEKAGDMKDDAEKKASDAMDAAKKKAEEEAEKLKKKIPQ